MLIQSTHYLIALRRQSKTTGNVSRIEKKGQLSHLKGHTHSKVGGHNKKPHRSTVSPAVGEIILNE